MVVVNRVGGILWSILFLFCNSDVSWHPFSLWRIVDMNIADLIHYIYCIHILFWGVIVLWHVGIGWKVGE